MFLLLWLYWSLCLGGPQNAPQGSAVMSYCVKCLTGQNAWPQHRLAIMENECSSKRSSYVFCFDFFTKIIGLSYACFQLPPTSLFARWFVFCLISVTLGGGKHSSELTGPNWRWFWQPLNSGTTCRLFIFCVGASLLTITFTFQSIVKIRWAHLKPPVGALQCQLPSVFSLSWS